MRIVAVGLRILLASLLAFSPMQWAEARSCDKVPPALTTAHASAHLTHEAHGGTGAVPAKPVAPHASQCCCDDGTCAVSGPCAHVFAALSAYSPPLAFLHDVFRAGQFVSDNQLLTHPPTPPPIAA